MTGVAAGLMQGRIGAFVEQMQGGFCRYLASAFSNLVSIPIVALGLSGHCNGYRATVSMIYNTTIAVICNNRYI